MSRAARRMMKGRTPERRRSRIERAKRKWGATSLLTTAKQQTREGFSMRTDRGTIVLMGSGELTATMVELHKSILRDIGGSAKAVFLDTPAGFQLNTDHLRHKALTYFKTRIHHPIQVASYKSYLEKDAIESLKAMETLDGSDYILIGPGSPTYALRQWRASRIPALFRERLSAGGCLVTASAAALTMGRFTLPVYELYKVGQDLHWVEGLDILGDFGLNMVVVPHWNNTEGGHHDTRFCFMGEPRFSRLEKMLPESSDILGLDEHTALILDLGRETARVYGLGRVVLRREGRDHVFTPDDDISLSLLRGEPRTATSDVFQSREKRQLRPQLKDDRNYLKQLNIMADAIREALDNHQIEKATLDLLTLEGFIWRHRRRLGKAGAMDAARERLRELIVLFGRRLARRPAGRKACLAPLVETLLTLRNQMRLQKQWPLADALRDSLKQAGVVVEDAPEGVRWCLDAGEKGETY